MSASLSGVFNLQSFTDLGALMAGGRLYTCAPATTTLKTAYTDQAGTIPHVYTSDGLGGQYIALNSRGELPAPLFLAAGGYDITLKTPAGVTVWTRRAIGGNDATDQLRADLANTSDATKGAGLVGLHLTGTGEVDTTVGEFANLERKGLRRNFGAVGDGVTNDYPALAAALASTGSVIDIEPGTYVFNSNLPTPTCAAIVGWGSLVSILKPGAAVTGTVLKANGNLRLADFKLDGSLTTGKAGIDFGNGATWFGVAERVRVQGFTGANAYGMRAMDTLKASIRDCYLDGNYDNLRLERGTPAFPTSTLFTGLTSVNATNVGTLVVDCDKMTFVATRYDSNAKGAIMFLPRAGGTITGFDSIADRFEDNSATQSTAITDGADRYQVVIGDGTALGGATIRGTMISPFFAPGASGARSIIANGSAVAGLMLLTPDCPASRQIVLLNGAYGDVSSSWAAALDYRTVVYDPSGNDNGPFGPMRGYVPTFSSSVGDYGASFSGSPTITACRYKAQGKNVRIDFDVGLQLIAVTPTFIKLTMPPGMTPQHNTLAAAQIIDNVTGKAGLCTTVVSDSTILVRPMDLSSFSSGAPVTLRGSVIAELT